MYYIDLPWYAFALWVVLALIVLLPWIAIPVIAVVAFVQGLFGHAPSTATSPHGFPVTSERLGVTMADGGEELRKKSKRNNSSRS